MTNALTKLEFNGFPVRIELINDEPWFVAMDICRVLGIVNHKDAFLRLDEDEKDVVGIADPHGRVQATQVINESGMYNLTFRSVKPQAQQFKRWVTHEVLPTLRKTGRFETQSALPTTSSLSVTPRNTLAVAKQLLIVAEEHENRLQMLEEWQEELESRPSLGAPPEGVLFPKLKPDHMTLRRYCEETGRKITSRMVSSMSATGSAASFQTAPVPEPTASTARSMTVFS